MVDECPRCGRGTEDSFHAVVACPTSSAVWDAMGEVWTVPAKETIGNTGDEWLFDLLVSLREEERAKVLMIVWRNWQLRNDSMHDKTVPPVKVSRDFLQSYMVSLNQIKLSKGYEMLKGKEVIRQEGSEARPQRGKSIQELAP